jgi:hypothetical protein
MEFVSCDGFFISFKNLNSCFIAVASRGLARSVGGGEAVGR